MPLRRNGSIGSTHFFILKFLFAGDYIFDVSSIAELLLVNGVSAENVVARLFGQMLERVFVDHAASVVFLLSFFESGEFQQKTFVDMFFAEEFDRPFVNSSRGFDVIVLLLEFGVTNPILRFGMRDNEAFVDHSCAFQFVVTQFEFDVGVPGLFVRLPFHPPFEDLSATGDVRQHFLHVRVFVPELIRAGKNGDRSIPNISRVIDLFVS